MEIQDEKELTKFYSDTKNIDVIPCRFIGLALTEDRKLMFPYIAFGRNAYAYLMDEDTFQDFINKCQGLLNKFKEIKKKEFNEEDFDIKEVLNNEKMSDNN